MLKGIRDLLPIIVVSLTQLKQIIVQLNVNCLQLSIFSTTSVRFCLKHFRDITIFNISNFVISYEIILN